MIPSLTRLRADPLPPLLAASDPAVRYLARRHLLAEPVPPPESIWDGAQVRRIVARQRPDGRWHYPGGNLRVRDRESYDQLETYRQLAVLVCKYGLDRRHPAVAGAAGFLRSFQAGPGDFRGIYGHQYSPNYSAAITELLIKAGYLDSPQVGNAMRWLASIRQDDGGWAIPARTRDLPLKAMLTTTETIEPDRGRPSAHLITGIVLRAMAAHPDYRHLAATRTAGRLLADRLFLRDTYADHAAPSFWLVFSFPYWWTDLLSALDTLAGLGFGPDDPQVSKGIAWFTEHQEDNGLWNTGRNRPKGKDSDAWVGLAICRMLAAAWGGG
jgi:hypothetical protein